MCPLNIIFPHFTVTKTKAKKKKIKGSCPSFPPWKLESELSGIKNPYCISHWQILISKLRCLT